MPRTTAALAVAAMLLLTAFTGASGGTSDAGAAPRRESSVAAMPRAVPETNPRGAVGPAPSVAFGRTAYERRLLDARRTSVTLDSVIGDMDRPNVLAIMADDMRDDDLRFMPNVQRLIADQGVRFTNSFSPHPLCCPARASFLTGQYTHNHEVLSHKAPYGFKVFDDSETLARWLHRDGGYDTAFIGKYLNGYGRMRLPDRSTSLRYIPPGWTDWRASVDHAEQDGSEHLQGGTYEYFDTTVSANGELESHQGRYQTDLYSEFTQQVIRRQATSPNPFFMYTSFAVPHVGSPREADDPEPFERSDGFRQRFQNPARPNWVEGRFDHVINRLPAWVGEDDVADKPMFLQNQPPILSDEREAILESYRQRVEGLSVLDDEIANIIETLERTGELDNTYVMFTSDNGFYLGEHRRRIGKITPYDPSLRVPMVMRGPGIPAGGERRDPFLTIDVAPTILDAAGLAPRADVDGVSMLDVARTGDLGWERPIMTESGPRPVSESTDERIDFLERETGPSLQRFSQGVRTGRYLYVEHASRETELYDMRRDPRQHDNVVGERRYRAVVRMLARELERLRTCEGAACSQPLPQRFWTDDPVPPVVWSPTRH